MKQLVQAIAELGRKAAQSTRLRTARLDSFAANRATLTLAGGTVTDVPYLTSYSPTAGDTVLVLQTDSGQLVILGRTT